MTQHTEGMVETLTDAADRFLKWVYKQPYSGPPVISIPRHAGNIDAILADAAVRVAGLESENAKLREALAAYDHAITMTRGEGGRRSWSMNGAKIAKAFDLHRAALKPEGGET